MYIDLLKDSRMNSILFEGLAAIGVYPISNTYGRYTVSINTTDTWIAVRGKVVADVTVRRNPGNEAKFDHCWRFLRLFKLYFVPHVPDPVSISTKFLSSQHSYFSF